jgi:hypothetical protein
MTVSMPMLAGLVLWPYQIQGLIRYDLGVLVIRHGKWPSDSAL